MKNSLGYLSLFFCLSFTASAEDNPVTFPERNVGYRIGDIIEQTISLDVDASTLPLETLAETRREGRWLARHSIELSDNNDKLTIRHQIINAPSNTRIISLPAVSLGNDSTTTINAPAWPFAVSPLIPTIQNPEDNPLTLMQADQLVKTTDTAPLMRRMKLMAYALVASLLLWLAWWLIRGFRDAQLLPFARAYRTLAKRRATADNQAPESWLALHEAFNQAGGRHIGLDSLDKLINNKPWLEPLEQEIRTFFKLSSSRFFSTRPVNDSLDVVGLSKRLYKEEKRHTARLEKTSKSTQAVA